jgi:hypothetical protein
MTSSLLFLLLLLVQHGRLAPPQDRDDRCFCEPASENEHTRWGNENVVISTVTRLRTLRGVVKADNDEALAKALVEVLTDPDILLLPTSSDVESRRARQRRVMACFTDDKGSFCIKRLPAGRYELRCSAPGFKTVSQTIRVIATYRIRKRVTVHLPVAN